MEPLALTGIGAGPANLALAIAWQEKTDAPYKLLESKPDFAWHPGMLIPDTTMQVPFLKDLVTLRNPTSLFSFLSFLKDEERLEEFVNLRALFPTRLEFNNYYKWVAAKLGDAIVFGRRVVAIRPVSQGSKIVRLSVVAERDDGRVETYESSSLSIAIGGRPRFVGGVNGPSAHVFHSVTLEGSLAGADRGARQRFVVVGGGQSAVEIVDHLHGAFPAAEIVWVLPGFAPRPADDSAFMNEVFFRSGVDLFFEASAEARARLLADCRGTNYAASDDQLINGLYKKLYADKVAGVKRVSLLRFHRVERISEDDGGCAVVAQRTLDGRIELVQADYVVLATGYDRSLPHELIGSITPYCSFSEEGAPILTRSFRVETVEHFLPKIFVQGASEASHGISDTLLSQLPYRSADIVSAALEDAVK